MNDNDPKRISPLRGLDTQDIVSQAKVTRNGLTSLRDEHYGILARIRKEEEGDKKDVDGDVVGKNDNDSLLEERVNHVTRSLERLEVGIEESSVLLRLHAHFEALEADRSTLRLEMARVADESDWLREELAEAQARVAEMSLELEDLRDWKRRWEFEEELKAAQSESAVRPVTPSKIPVGSWRVEEEKDINRALNGEKVRSSSPAPSLIPVPGWKNRAGSAYKNLMEKETQKKAAAAAAASRANGVSSSSGSSSGYGQKRPQYFKLNAQTNRAASKIPAR